MGHIPDLRNQFKSINTFVNHNVDLKRRKTIISFFYNQMILICKTTSPKDALSQVWLKLAKWFLRR